MVISRGRERELNAAVANVDGAIELRPVLALRALQFRDLLLGAPAICSFRFEHDTAPWISWDVPSRYPSITSDEPGDAEAAAIGDGLQSLRREVESRFATRTIPVPIRSGLAARGISDQRYRSRRIFA